MPKCTSRILFMVLPKTVIQFYTACSLLSLAHARCLQYNSLLPTDNCILTKYLNVAPQFYPLGEAMNTRLHIGETTVHGRKLVANLVTGPSASVEDPFRGTTQPSRVDSSTGLQTPLPGRLPRQSGSGPWHIIVRHTHFTAEWLAAFRRTNLYDDLLVGLPAGQNHIPSNGRTGQNQPAQF